LGSGLVLLSGDFLRLGLLGCDALLSALAGLLVLHSPGLSLIGQLLGSQSLGFFLVDEFHQNSLVLEHVSLGFDVELVIEMSVDLLVFAVFLEQSPQDSHTPHPQFLNRHASVGSSLALAGTRVTTLSASKGIFPRTRARVNRLRLLDDQTVLDQPTDVLSGVGVGDLIDFVGVHPDFVGAAF